MVNGALFFISALGAFNGLILGVYFLVSSRKENIANLFLGALLIALSLRIGKSVLYYFNTSLLLVYLQIGLSACWFIGPFLFYYVRSEIRQVKELPKSWAWIILSMALIIVATGLVFPYQQYPIIWNRYFVQIIYAQWGVFLFLSAIELKDLFIKIARPRSLKRTEIWLISALTAITVIFICYLWALLGHSKGIYISGAIIFSIVLYAIGFYLLHRRKQDFVVPASQKYANKKIKESDAQLMLYRLERIMADKEVFRNPNLKLTDLAAEINASSHQLSQLLNESLGKSFTLYINEYRIDEACRILAATDNLTIEAVGEEVGFNSKSTFFSAFKKLKGVTPAVYQQGAIKV
ncbi:helix-turn-helix domain-containing protein [Chryseolinea sp. T2]|uniref:helix-turn-helix domain-containing protein n=1 Tax=Chryseolinea sp. T2 TaxID=3129255 RepID=UPI003077EBFD